MWILKLPLIIWNCFLSFLWPENQTIYKIGIVLYYLYIYDIFVGWGDAWENLQIDITALIRATSWENLFTSYANNKGADQPAHPRSLISAFIVRCIGSIISRVSIFAISWLVCFYSWAGQFESYLVPNPEDRFSHDEAHLAQHLPLFIGMHVLQVVLQWHLFCLKT